MALPGMGRHRAEALVLWRLRHGRFARLEDLTRVPGLGPRTVAGFQDWLVLPR